MPTRSIRMGREIKDAIESTVTASIRRCRAKAFTARSSPERRAPCADLRSATVLDGEVLRRSPGMTGTAALMAVLDAMGLLTDDRGFTHEGVLGTTLQGSVVSRHQMGERASRRPRD